MTRGLLHVIFLYNSSVHCRILTLYHVAQDGCYDTHNTLWHFFVWIFRYLVLCCTFLNTETRDTFHIPSQHLAESLAWSRFWTSVSWMWLKQHRFHYIQDPLKSGSLCFPILISSLGTQLSFQMAATQINICCSLNMLSTLSIQVLAVCWLHVFSCWNLIYLFQPNSKYLCMSKCL